MSQEIADTVSAIAEIAGKSIQSLHRAISILKLFDEIKRLIFLRHVKFKAVPDIAKYILKSYNNSKR